MIKQQNIILNVYHITKHIQELTTMYFDFVDFDEVDKGVKKKDIALKFGIPPNSLSTIIKYHHKIENDTLTSCSKHLKTCAYKDVDAAVLKWICLM